MVVADIAAQVVADIAVAADNKALVVDIAAVDNNKLAVVDRKLVVDIAAAVDYKKLAVADRKLAAHNLVAKNMAAVVDNNNPAQYCSKRQNLGFLLLVWFQNQIQPCRKDKDRFYNYIEGIKKPRQQSAENLQQLESYFFVALDLTSKFN